MDDSSSLPAIIPKILDSNVLSSSDVPGSGVSPEIDSVVNTTQVDEDDEDDWVDEDEVEGYGDEEGFEDEPLDVTIERVDDSYDVDTLAPAKKAHDISTTVVFEDPSDEDDGEGEWITPTNVGIYKSRALDLLPSADSRDSFTTVSRKAKQRKSRANNDNSLKAPESSGQIYTGCMTADFAMQNVLLHMGLNLIGIEGKRISTVKSWVLRCHACFKYVTSLLYAFFAHTVIESVKTTPKNFVHLAEILLCCVLPSRRPQIAQTLIKCKFI